MTLLDMKPVRDVIRLCLETARIKYEFPVSLLFLARPESGKTQSLEEFKHVKYVHYTNDITPKYFTDYILPAIDKGELEYLMIPDILNCIEKNRATRMRFINIIKTLIEEGITRIDCYQMKYTPQHKGVLRCGLITAITADSYRQVRSSWSSIGFLSRMVPFSYSYDRVRVHEIMKFIASLNGDGREVKMKDKFPTRLIDVKGDRQLFLEFESIGTQLGSQAGAYGFRVVRSLKTLAKASAVLDGRDEVVPEDIKRVMELARWMNYDFNVI